MAKKTKFELAVIDKVKAMRISKNLSQDDIAVIINKSRGFVGQIESPNSGSKYNLNHLNLLAKGMNCSPKDFMPDGTVKEE